MEPNQNPPSEENPTEQQPTLDTQPLPQEISSNQTETPTTQDEKVGAPQHRVLKIVLIIFGSLLVLFSAILIAGYLYLQSQGLTPDKLSPEPKAPQTTIAPRDTTTNTYQNQNYKFSMPLANDLQVKESPYGFGVTSIEMRSKDTSEEYGADFQMLLFPKALGATIGQDFDKYYALLDNATQEIKDPSGISQNFTKVRNRTINKSRAFEFKSNSIPADPEVDAEIGVYIEIGSDVLVITTGESNKEEFESMLADFKYPLD